MPTSVGDVFVDILPNLEGFAAKLDAEVGAASEEAAKVATEAAQSVGEAWTTVGAESGTWSAPVIAGAEEAAQAGTTAAADVTVAWREAGAGAGTALEESALASFSAAVDEGSIAAKEVTDAWVAAGTGAGTELEASIGTGTSAAVSKSVAASREVEAAWRAAGVGAGTELAAGVTAGADKAAAASSSAAAKTDAAWRTSGIVAGDELAAGVTAGSEKAVAAGVASAEKVSGAWAAAKSTLTGLFSGALALGGLDLLTKGAVDYGHQLILLSSAFHVSEEEAAKLKTQADLVGVSITAVIPAIARLTKSAADNTTGTGAMLEQYGIAVDTFRNAGLSEQLSLLSEAYLKAGKRGNQFLSDVLGGRGLKIAPLLAEYEGLQHATSGIHFPVPSHKDILDMEKFQVEMSRLITTVEVKVIPVVVRFEGVIKAALAAWAFVKIAGFFVSLGKSLAAGIVELGTFTTAAEAAAAAAEAEGVAVAGAATAAETAIAGLGGAAAILGGVGELALIIGAIESAIDYHSKLVAERTVETAQIIRGQKAAAGLTAANVHLADATKKVTEATHLGGIENDALQKSTGALATEAGTLTKGGYVPLVGAQQDVTDQTAILAEAHVRAAAAMKSFKQETLYTKVGVQGLSDAVFAQNQKLQGNYKTLAEASAAVAHHDAVVQHANDSYRGILDTFAQVSGSAIAVSDSFKKGETALVGFGNGISGTFDANIAASLANVRAGIAAFRQQLASTLDQTGTLFDKWAQHPHEAVSGMNADVQKAIGQMQTWRQEWNKLVTEGAPQKLLGQFAQGGLDSLSIMQRLADSPKNVRDKFFSNFSQMKSTTESVAASIQRAMTSTFQEMGRAIITATDIATGHADRLYADLQKFNKDYHTSVLITAEDKASAAIRKVVNDWNHTHITLIMDIYTALHGRGLAKGGPVMGQQPYLVGEKGPELFVPTSDGHIVPHGQMPAIMPRSQNAAAGSSDSGRSRIIDGTVKMEDSGEMYFRLLAQDVVNDELAHRGIR